METGSRAPSRTAVAESEEIPPDAVDDSGLKRQITLRELIFLALSGSIGAGLFVASGGALSSGGPGNVVINYFITGILVIFTMGALGEMCTNLPISGSFYEYSVRFLSPELGLTVGWIFILMWITVVPFELTTMGAQLKYWTQAIKPEYFIAPLLFLLCVINFFGTNIFSKAETGLGAVKIVAVTLFIGMAATIAAGGAPGDPRPKPLGFRYFIEQPFKNGFSGFLHCFRVAGMSYGGTELLAMTVRETKDPRRAMPIATYFVFARILLFYVVTLFLLGMVVPADHPELAQDGHGASYSPFALAAKLANLKGFGDFYNGAILCALLSMANMAVYSTSRALQAIAHEGMAPRFLERINQRGIPTYALAVTLGFGLSAFFNCLDGGERMFDWLLNICAHFDFYIWIAINASFIRFRAALKQRARSTDELLWRNPFGAVGSYVAIGIAVVALASNPVALALPLENARELTKAELAAKVVRENVGIVVPWIIWGGATLYHALRKDGKKFRFFTPLEELDIDKGRLKKEVDVETKDKTDGVTAGLTGSSTVETQNGGRS